MYRKLVSVFILLIISILGFSQNPKQDSIAPKKAPVSPTRPIDSTFVTYKAFQFDSIFLNASNVIDTLTFHVTTLNTLERENTIYSTESNPGMAHKSMRFSDLRPIGFDMTLPAFSAYMKNERNIISYQSVLPYSELRYLTSFIDKQQHLNAKFGRQFTPRLFVSFEFNTDLAPTTFINNKTINNYFWVNAHYFTKNNRYGICAYWYRNKLEMQENGGIVNDENYSSHTESDNMVIPTQLKSATNFVVSSGIGFEHYFNLLSQNVSVKASNDSIQAPFTDSLAVDSIAIDSFKLAGSLDTAPKTKARKFTLGRICHSFSYLYNKLYYTENSPRDAFYLPYDTLLSIRKTTDSTMVRAFKNSLKWNSLGYQKYDGDVPFYAYAGVTHGYYMVKRYDYLEEKTLLERNYHQLSVNGGVIVSLFKSARITAHGELITLGYQIGDFDVKGQWRQLIGTTAKNYGKVVFDVDLKRQSPTWFETSYYSNHFRWENDFKAATYLTLNLKYQFRDYCIGVKQTSISNYIYFGTDARPAQNEGMFSIREAYLSFYQKIWRFELEGFASLQKASNEEVMHLPLVQASLKIGYEQPIFRKKATLYPSITVRYFTKYHADAYMPVTRTFFLQNDVEIGNFPYLDVALAIKVKKAHIFAAYSNMFLLFGNYNSFIAPHYPMHASQVYLGITWRLFN